MNLEASIKKCLPTYRIKKKIGEGIYGCVYQVLDDLKERAVKVVPIMIERSQMFKDQNVINSKISQDFHAVKTYYEKIKGDGVMEIYDFHLIYKKMTKRVAQADVVILMELCTCNLRDYVQDNHPLETERITEIALSLASVLKRLTIHEQELFLLTDLKPPNLLFNTNMELVIGDLGGLKRKSSESTTTNAQFSPDWTAPEIALAAAKPSVRSVIYSYGLILYYLCEGHLPYEDLNFMDRLREVKEKGVLFSREDLPSVIKDKISVCLQFDEEKRPESFSDLLEKPEKAAPSYSNFVSTSQTDWIDPESGMEFIFVKGGPFKMGAISDDVDSEKNEFPAHEVYINDFWMGKYPVTQGEWVKITGENPSHYKLEGRYPVENITWEEGKKFTETMIKLHKRDIIFSIPTEAQWEFAAKNNGEVLRFPGTGRPDNMIWHSGNSFSKPHPVGEKEPTEFGLYDMCGNVFEWCEDIYGGYQEKLDFSQELSSAIWDRVCRGGAFNMSLSKCRTTSRRKYPPGFRYPHVGLRVIMYK